MILGRVVGTVVATRGVFRSGASPASASPRVRPEAMRSMTQARSEDA